MLIDFYRRYILIFLIKGSTKTQLLESRSSDLRRVVTMRRKFNDSGGTNVRIDDTKKTGSATGTTTTVTAGKPGKSVVKSTHNRTSSVNSSESSRHGQIIRLEQKATKVLGIVFFTFVILWAPFFVINLLLAIFPELEKNINSKIFDLVTWLGYSSSMVNPIFYTIFNKVFRLAFKRVLLCKPSIGTTWRPPQSTLTTRCQDYFNNDNNKIIIKTTVLQKN